MKKIIIGLLLSTTIVSGAQAQDYGVRESTAWFGELVHKWETSYKKSNRQELTDGSYNAQGIDGTGHRPSHGWCNEAVVWAMDHVDVFDQAQIDAGSLNTMRGRHWTSVNNDNVVETFNHNETFNWDDVPIGTVTLHDFQSNPTTTGSLGIDHVSTFMGKVNDEWGWFLGGNQNGKLQPKLYKLSDVTFASTFSQQDHTADKHYYDNVEEMARIKLEDGEWSKTNNIGWSWGKNTDAKYTNGGPATSWWMSKQWNQLGPNIQKFQSGENVVYIQTDDAMEVYENQVIRSIDYYDHVEINEMKNHIGEFQMFDRNIQRDYKWWSSRTNQDSATFLANNEEGSQWHDRVYTAKAVDEAIDGQFERAVMSVVNTHRDHQSKLTADFLDTFNDPDSAAREEHYDYSLARELYMEYGVEYYNDDETLMSDHYETQ